MANKGLIVDDDKNIIKILSLFLGNHGIDIICAENGSQAIEILLSNEVNFILTDLNMPGINGMELVQFIQSNLPDLPVFLMSGDIGGLEGITRDFECVRNTFQKPFNLPSLMQSILFLTNCGELVL